MQCTLKNADLCVTCHFISPTLALIFPLIYTYCGMFFYETPNQTPRMHFYSLPDAHALDGTVCAPLNIILSATEYSSARIFFVSCPLMFWFIKTVVTKLIPFKTYLCVMFFFFRQLSRHITRDQRRLDRMHWKSDCPVFGSSRTPETGFPLSKTLVATTLHLCCGRLRKKETCSLML